MNIPLHRAYWNGKEKRAANRAIDSFHGSAGGKFTGKLISAMLAYTKSSYALPVTSCTHGLELAMIAMGIAKGDEVIVPSFTMSSTANAVVLRGATPVFADIDPIYSNIDPEDIERKVTKKTKGIIIVHYAGIACQMEKIQRIAKKHALFIVEDAAHALGAWYKGKSLGTVSDVGVYSFHDTKNISCGEGGMVLTQDKDLADRMEIIKSNGTNRKAYLEGMVDKYSWVDVGSSYMLSDILAAIAFMQMGKIAAINERRNRIADAYTKALGEFSDYIHVPSVPEYCVPNWHIYPLIFPTVETRKAFMEGMRRKGIEVSLHYIPLHSSKMGLELRKGKALHLPVTEKTAQTLVRLPIFAGMTNRELTYITRTARKILTDIFIG